MGVSEGGEERGCGSEDAVTIGLVGQCCGGGKAYRGVSSWSV